MSRDKMCRVLNFVSLNAPSIDIRPSHFFVDILNINQQSNFDRADDFKMTVHSLTTRRLVLRLYRDLQRYGSQLQLTDKDYFRHRIRTEFTQNRDLIDPKEIEFAYKRGRTLLDRARVI